MTDPETWITVTASGLTILSVIVSHVLKQRDLRRQRDWDIADREAARAALADKMEADRYNQLVLILEQFRQVMAKLVEGLQAAKTAYKEANDVNLKMARLHEDMAKIPKVVVVPVATPHPPRATDPVVQSPKEDV